MSRLSFFLSIILFAGVFLSSEKVFAQRGLKDIPSSDPAIEQASFRLADGFEVNLWAADPLLAKPIQIQFDAKGRLWVACSETYPQLNVNQDPSDKIIILEDTDKDGSADKSLVYYDKLIIPGGVLPDNLGGAYVAHAEKLVHLTDNDGDGVADKSEVLLSGFGTEDTHHTLHRLSWGPGGLLYMLQGYYIGTHVETLYGPRRLNGGGLWSFNTNTRRLEIYSRGLINPWGVVFDRWGQTFQTDGAGGEGINYSFPEAVFKGSPHENRTLSGSILEGQNCAGSLLLVATIFLRNCRAIFSPTIFEPITSIAIRSPKKEVDTIPLYAMISSNLHTYPLDPLTS